MKRILTLLSVLVALVILAVAIIGGAVLLSDMKIVSKSEINSSTVLERVKAISELNTTEMYFNEILDFSDTKYLKAIKIPLTTKKVILTIKARVKAGVDLSNLSEDAIRVDGTSIRIDLPKPVITSKEILESSVYDEQDGLFNEVTSEDTLMLIEEYTKQLDQEAMEVGILEKAQDNAELVVRSLLQMMGFEEIDVRF